MPRKTSPVTPPGIDPGTFRIVEQFLKHYASQALHRNISRLNHLLTLNVIHPTVLDQVTVDGTEYNYCNRLPKSALFAVTILYTLVSDTRFHLREYNGEIGVAMLFK
jgi:hypothetical protein